MSTAILLAILFSVGMSVLVIGIVSPPSTKSIGKFFSSAPKASRSSLGSAKTGTEFLKGVAKNKALRTQILVSVILGIIFFLGTRWPVAGLFGFTLGWMSPQAVFARTRGSAVVKESEAWTQWTEQLRSLVSSGNSIPDAISASSSSAPAAIQANVEILAQDILRYGVSESLDRFAVRADSEQADRVILGLQIAYETGGRVSDSFTDLSTLMRSDVELRRKAEASRRVIWNQGILSFTVSLLLVFAIVLINRGYLEPYDSLGGQMVLAVAAGLFVFALWMILNSTIIKPKARLLADLEFSDGQVVDVAVSQAVNAAEAVDAPEEKVPFLKRDFSFGGNKKAKNK